MLDYYTTPDLYDLIYAPFRADVGYVVREARAARGPVLEVACGSGRLLLPMLEAGVDADGLDLAPAMLAATRRRAAAKGLRADVVAADMRDFTMPRRYAWIVIAFNAFYHNLTQDDQLATLRRCREHLLEGGSLTLVTFHPDLAKLASFDGTPLLALEHDRPGGAGRVRVWDAVAGDTLAQVNRVTRRVQLLDPAGALEREFELGFTLRYCWAPELELLLRAAGFARFECRVPFEKYTDEAPCEPPRPPRAGATLAWRAWKD